MKRTSILALALVAAALVAGSSSAQRSDLLGARLSPSALAPDLGAAIDARLSEIELSVRKGGSAAALATARSQGLLVTQGKVRVVVYARSGHVAGARKAVRLAHGNVVATSGKLIEAVLPPKALQKLAADKHVARLRPVASAATLSTVTGLSTAVVPSSVANMDGFAPEGFGLDEEATMPEPPTALSVDAGDAHVTVSFTPPLSDGGDGIVYYTATASPGGQSANSTGDPISVSGLTNGVEYTFTVTATNRIGSSGASAPSDPVTPAGSSRLTLAPPGATPRPGIPSIPGSPVRNTPPHDDPPQDDPPEF
jgi:hypothetical protein